LSLHQLSEEDGQRYFWAEFTAILTGRASFTDRNENPFRSFSTHVLQK